MRLTPMSRDDSALTVLAVDDEPVMLLGTVSMLETLGWDVLSAHSGDAAIERLTAGHGIAAIVTDHSLPGISGLELIDAARRMGRPIGYVLTTGHPDLGPEAATAWVHLVKPFTREELADALDKALKIAGITARPAGSMPRCATEMSVSA